jgi:hypothetical protein
MTVEEVLRQSGFTNDQIASLEPRAITAFSGVLDEAQRAREAAELAQRSNRDFYDNQIAPSLVQWDEERQRVENERATAAAEAAFYRTQAEQAKASGFIPAEAPGFQPRDHQGRYMAGAGATPGSPGLIDMDKLAQRAGDAIGILTDISWEHQRLFNQPLPISPSELVRQADLHKLDPRTYASRQFNWDKRREEMQKAEQEKHDAKIRSEAVAENDRKWAEKIGSNPDVRIGQSSRYADAQRGVKSGNRPDPIMLGESERRAATRAAIRNELAEQER